MRDAARPAPGDMPGADPFADAPMTAAELLTVSEWLGLTQRDLAAILGVNERTLRGYVSGRYPIPDWLPGEVERIEAFTAAAVGQVVAALGDMRDPAVVVYRRDEELWGERPEFAPYPARWWRMVVARAASEVPGVVIEYAPARA